MIKTSTRPERRRAKSAVKKAQRYKASAEEARQVRMANASRWSANPKRKPRLTYTVLVPGAEDLRPDRYLHSAARQGRALRNALAAAGR